MAYGNDFYVKANIIGYTGDLNDNPTVYFQKGNRFGRITQDHPHANNIGRNRVREYTDYRISNVDGKAQEYYNGSVRHTSRNSFIAVTSDTAAVLALAISNFPNKKPKYD